MSRSDFQTRLETIVGTPELVDDCTETIVDVSQAMILGDPNDYLNVIVICGTMTVTTTIFLSYRSEFTLTINA